MSILMTIFTFEGDFLIIYYLQVVPPVNGENNELRQAFLKIYFNTNLGTRENWGFWFRFVYIFPQSIPYCLKVLIVPAMKGKMGELDLDRNCLWNIFFWVE